MSRFEEMGAALAREIEAFLLDATVDASAAPAEVAAWLDNAPPGEIGAVRGYVRPNPRNDVAMYFDGRAHSRCPEDCDGCRCPFSAPCVHCTEHEPASPCGCPHFTLEDTGEHGPECALRQEVTRPTDDS